MLAGVYQPNELLPLVSRLLRIAGIRKQDTLIDLSDRAIGIDQVFVSVDIAK